MLTFGSWQAHLCEILDVLELLGMIEARLPSISTVEDVPLAKPIVAMVIQAKTAMQGTIYIILACLAPASPTAR